MKHRHRVFVSGPYSRGDTILNIRAAILAGSELSAAGLAPFVPHQNALWYLVAPADYETWMEIDFAFVRVCEAVLRLPGHSPGADRECALALSLGLPVFDSVAEVVQHFEEFDNAYRP